MSAEQKPQEDLKKSEDLEKSTNLEKSQEKTTKRQLSKDSKSQFFDLEGQKTEAKNEKKRPMSCLQ